ncbi:DNA-deoxyinosine glycosylase [Leeia sp. TBRC 13508]|uniref:DNA-deoxyinosine glycosylase n=1 Tax=Leeia speluncae TaxID=2884804 RepID=A0ABS8D2H4_9NEIS|nr:DNA-deoxyinosine glycosylase [Leeia speluncae]MCB6182186.1 DNA-deoxyinosine glycosylase [Leeia speluncae]
MTEFSECFPPVTQRNTKVLVLGSLPGAISLSQQQYYAHPRNHFWPIIAEIILPEILPTNYPERLSALLSAQIGLWDVVAKAQRKGSLDNDIREATHNSLGGLIETLPALKLVVFNGKTAGKAASQLPEGLAHLVLPSTSPAYTLPFKEKLAAWLAIKDYL